MSNISDFSSRSNKFQSSKHVTETEKRGHDNTRRSTSTCGRTAKDRQAGWPPYNGEGDAGKVECC